MNTGDSAFEFRSVPPERLVATSSNSSAPGKLWLRRLNWIVAGNPFYPLSVVLVLLGVFLLSGNDRMFDSEAGQLHFNFSALEAYGFLVAATAVCLFRRTIYYDTLLLVVLAVMPILVPFILISQGAFMGATTMTVMCVLAVVLGFGQFVLIRRGIRELPISRGLPWLLVVVLSVNLVLPVLLKNVQARLDAIPWAVQQDRYWHLGWTLLMPVLVLMGFALPRSTPSHFGDCRAGWLTVSLTGLLVAGTAAHMASLGYVYSYPWRMNFAHPAGWLFAWLIWWRRDEWSAGVSGRWPALSLVAPALAAVLSVFQTGSSTLLWLNFANVALYAVVSIAPERRRLGAALVLTSIAGLILSLPLPVIRFVFGAPEPFALLLLIVSCLGFVVSWTQRRPAWALVAALSTLMPGQHFWLRAVDDLPLAGQLALIAWWIHSLGWKNGKTSQPRWLQQVVFSVWLLHGLLWYFHNGGAGRLPLSAIALFMSASAGWLGWRHQRVCAWILCGLALALAALPGANEVMIIAKRIPAGLWVLVVGLICFAFGTASALLKKRWRT